MKIGEIKIEALKLMFSNYSFDAGIDDLVYMLGDENYGSYIVNMNGSIARALDRIQNACVLPLKSRRIEKSELVEGGLYSRFDTSLIEDLFDIDRIIAETDYSYNGNAAYLLEGNDLLLENGCSTYTVLYYPTIKTLDDKVTDEDELWIPGNIARLIPYFIKGELYQEEEPDLAADARNIFEMSLDDLKKHKQSNQTRVKRVI